VAHWSGSVVWPSHYHFFSRVALCTLCKSLYATPAPDIFLRFTTATAYVSEKQEVLGRSYDLVLN
jgi:hypothetical protein